MKWELNKSKIFEATVMGAYTNGKSTLVNALLGRSVLPATMKPCTKRTLHIINNRSLALPLLHTVAKSGNQSRIYIKDADIALLKQKIEVFDAGTDESDIIIEAPFASLNNIRRCFVLTDTVGANNAMRANDFQSAMSVLSNITRGVILYLAAINQISSKDNLVFLNAIAEKMNECPRLQMIVVISKMDMFNPAQEGISELLDDCKELLQLAGINKYAMAPVSAEAALLFRKALAGRLEETERRVFWNYYAIFSTDETFDLSAAIHNKKVKIGNEELIESKLLGAIRNTGISMLESLIEQALISTIPVYHPARRNSIKISKA